MAYTTLKDDYSNDVLNTVANSNVKYIVTDNGDGTISLQDATSYSTLGDSLDASVVNSTNSVVNAHSTDLTQAKADIITNATDIGVLQAGKVDFDPYALPGTTDGDLAAILTDLGWISDVIE